MRTLYGTGAPPAILRVKQWHFTGEKPEDSGENTVSD